MNRLIIIGNGFDLAHGLETRYSDFMLDYLKGFLANIKVGREYSTRAIIKDDNFIQLYANRSIYGLQLPKINENDSFQTIVTKLNQEWIGLKSDFELIQSLLTSFSFQNWVDVENEYFQLLKKYSQGNRKDQIIELNTSFELLKSKFIEYLSTIDTKVDKKDGAFRLLSGLIYREIKDEKLMSLNSSVISDNILILSFNYTNTIDLYIHEQNNLRGASATEIKIHGDLSDPLNPIIFGYGDDHHEDYPQIERANEREYLVNMKHMHYSRTSNYEVMLNFLETGNLLKKKGETKDFQVLVLGHSCGLSDRTMLKTIFEHPNCKEIHLAYHGTEEDHFYKTIEVSRHFSDKAEMRRKLKSINKYLMMPQFQKSNQSS